MKLRVKIPVIYVLSLILSAVIFILAIWGLMTYGWWSGITQADMDRAVSGAAENITSADAAGTQELDQIFGEWKSKYPGMEMELLSEEEGILYSTSSAYSIGGVGELITALSKNGQMPKEKWVAAHQIELKNSDTAYTIAIVPAKYYVAAAFTLNGNKGYGIFGKMFVIGMCITIVVSCCFALLFTRKILKRFESLYRSIDGLSMGNLDIQIEDDTNDEIGKLTSTYKSMADRLKKQIESVKTYEEERKKLISDISHDLRTPLTSIIGYSESLENQLVESEEEQNRYITIIHKKAVFMDRLLSELMEFSRLESGKLELHKEKNELSELAREILIEYLPALEKENIELTVDIPDKGLEIYCDKNMISRVIRNIMDNAIKYGKSGRKIDFLLIEEDSAYCIKIKDYGPGISSENVKLVFNRFYRVQKGRTAGEGGMGLGLAIAEKIVGQHGGRIEAQSEPEKGVTFIVTLPKS